MKAFLVVSGRKLETMLSMQAEKLLKYINKIVGPLPKSDNDDPLAMDLKKMVKIIEESIPRM